MHKDVDETARARLDNRETNTPNVANATSTQIVHATHKQQTTPRVSLAVHRPARASLAAERPSAANLASARERRTSAASRDADAHSMRAARERAASAFGASASATLMRPDPSEAVHSGWIIKQPVSRAFGLPRRRFALLRADGTLLWFSDSSLSHLRGSMKLASSSQVVAATNMLKLSTGSRQLVFKGCRPGDLIRWARILGEHVQQLAAAIAEPANSGAQPELQAPPKRQVDAPPAEAAERVHEVPEEEQSVAHQLIFSLARLRRMSGWNLDDE